MIRQGAQCTVESGSRTEGKGVGLGRRRRQECTEGRQTCTHTNPTHTYIYTHTRTNMFWGSCALSTTHWPLLTASCNTTVYAHINTHTHTHETHKYRNSAMQCRRAAHDNSTAYSISISIHWVKFSWQSQWIATYSYKVILLHHINAKGRIHSYTHAQFKRSSGVHAQLFWFACRQVRSGQHELKFINYKYECTFLGATSWAIWAIRSLARAGAHH
jgi:hypothetical protein